MGYLDNNIELTGNVIFDHWNGRYSLGRSYWVNGVIIAGIGGALLIAASKALVSIGMSLQLASAVSIITLCLGVIIWIWSAVGTWRSADRHTDNGGNVTWAALAKGLIVLGALASAGRLVSAAPGIYEMSRLASNSDPLGKPASVVVNGETVTLFGPIAEGTAQKFADTISRHSNLKLLRLTSVGGRIRDADQIASLIKKRGMDTLAVRHCESACTVIFLAGHKRAALAGSGIGFHQPSFPGLQPAEHAQMVDDLRSSYLASGLTASFVSEALSEPSDRIWYPTEPELFKAGVLNSFPPERIVQENLAQADAINKIAPKRLDSLTTLLSASAAGNSLTYRYRVDAYVEQVDKTNFTKAILRSDRAKLCSQSLTPEFMQAGANFHYLYVDQRGKKIAEVVVDSCQ